MGDGVYGSGGIIFSRRVDFLGVIEQPIEARRGKVSIEKVS